MTKHQKNTAMFLQSFAVLLTGVFARIEYFRNSNIVTVKIAFLWIKKLENLHNINCHILYMQNVISTISVTVL